jgi:phage tail sheath protein FI
VHRTATISAELDGPLTMPLAPRVTITIGDKTKTVPLALDPATVSRPVPLNDIAAALQEAIARDTDTAFANAVVTVVNKRLVVLAGENQEVRFRDAAAMDTTATDLKLTAATQAKVNVAEYQLVYGKDAEAPPKGQDLIGSPVAKTGIFALDDVDLFNLLCIPAAAHASLSDSERAAVISTAVQYCVRRRAFFLIDTPADVEDPTAIKKWLGEHDSLRSPNAALYYPRVKIPDPLDGFRLRSVGASGTVAGVYARTDGARGVWKAPAGTEATVRNVTALDDLLTDGENGTLNPLAINCLRTFPVYGNVVWGARTLEGADQNASEWKYIPVRRLALFLEESLYRGTKWVVFEPNDEPLWAQIRLNLGAFMHNLFRQGAFQGATPRDAYFVKCDKETTTQNDINLGIVNIVVGFAPLKPAEFVIIKFQQMAGQIAT